MEETRYWTEAKRKSIVTKTFVRALNDGDALFPDPDKLTAPSDSWLRTAIEKRETI